METSESGKKVILTDVDGNWVSFYSLEWTLDHLLVPPTAGGNRSPFKDVLVHVKIPTLSVLKFSKPGVTKVLLIMEKDLKKIVSNVVEKAKLLFQERSKQRRSLMSDMMSDPTPSQPL